jgi:hypothetical protein
MSCRHISIYRVCYKRSVSKQADAWSPVVFGCGLGVDDDVVREGVCVSGCDGGDVVFVAVDDANDLMRGLLQRLGHGTADLDDVFGVRSATYVSLQPREHTGFRPWLGKGDIQSPLLPANLLVCLAEEVRLSPLLLEELHHKLPASSLLVCAVYRSHQGYRPLVDQRFQVHIVDGGEGEVEQVAGERRDGGEVAMEENGVQNCCNRRQLRSSDRYEVRVWSMSDGGEAGVTQKPLQRSRESGIVQEDMRTHPSRHLSRMPGPQRSRGCTRVAGVVPCWHQQSGCWYHGARRSHVVPAQQGACWSSTVKLAPAKLRGLSLRRRAVERVRLLGWRGCAEDDRPGGP